MENLTEKELEKLKEAYLMKATHLEAIYHSGVEEEKHKHWFVYEGGKELIEHWKIEQSWNEKLKVHGKAKGLFLEPTDHREAEAVLKRHPLTKKDYSDRTEHTGAEGKDLQPVLVRFINGKDEPA